jgi:hypothetical protein
LDTSGDEVAVAANQERVRLLACNTCKRRTDLAAAAGIEHLDLQAHGASSGFHVSQGVLGIHRVGRIDKRDFGRDFYFDEARNKHWSEARMP